MGVDLTYSCIGNSQYRVTLTFYRDCNGINATTNALIRWSGACGNGTTVLRNRTVEEITPSCPGIVGSACNGGNGVFGIEKYTYTDTLTLPSGCTNVSLSYQTCCRNGAITTLDNPLSEGIYVEADILDNSLCNNSPVFTNNPVPFGCVNQPVFYNHGATDADGDSLSYSFVDCYARDTMTVDYASGFSATNPLTATGLMINANTGAISFTPTMAQVAVFCVAVQEFRNGTLIGQVVRDIQFTAVPCSNNVPTVSGVNNTTDFSASVQAGTQLCFDVFSNDLDNNQATTLSWNNGIAGATFTTSGAPFANGRFCWTPTTAGTFSFTVNVRDNFCPVVGQNTYTYTITVTSPPPPPPSCDSLMVMLVNSTDLACDSSDGTATILASSGVAPYNYQVVNWTTGVFYNNTTGQFTGLTAGNYTIWVTDANGCTPSCTGQAFTINGTVTPLTASATATSVDCPSNSRNAQEPDNLTGAITVTAAGGTPAYMYSIDGGNSFQASSNFDLLAAGTYTVVVMDANGCTETTTATVVEPAPIQISIVNVTAAICGNNNGSITLLASGGTNDFVYYINGVAQGNNPTFDSLAPGSYTFRVCDTNYCVYDTTFTIPDTVVALMVAATGQNVDCPSNSINTQEPDNLTGMINTTVANGTAPFTYSLDGGATQASADFDFLSAGTYTVDVTDANGCTGSTSVTITEPDPIQISVASLTPALCGQSTGSITLVASGGTGSFLYYINGVSQSSSTFDSLAPGTYNFRVCDMNYCVFDTSFTIPNTPGIVGIGTSTTPSCVGDCDGTATVSTVDSSTTTVAWDNGATTATITGLCAGSYTATITASNGCTDVVTVTVADPAPVDVTLTSTTDETCALNDGAAVITATGGSAPYSFNLANFTTAASTTNSTGVFTNQNAGQFVVNVTDANGCSADCSTSFTLAGCTGGGGGGDDDDDDDDDGGGIFQRRNVLTMTPIALDVNPNPASSIVQVRYQSAATSVQLSVIDGNGKMVFNQKANNAEGSLEIPVNNWANSTYFVLLKDQDGKIVKSTKLVISK